MDLLGARDYNQLSRKFKLTKPALSAVLTLIQSLKPRPGSLHSNEQPEYIIPDVFVYKQKDRWRVELNADTVSALARESVLRGPHKTRGQ